MRLFTTLLLLGAAATVHAAPQINPKRAIVVQGEIAGMGILTLGDKLEQFAKESKEPIDIAINSPGGSVIVGFLFINRMESVKSQGVKLRCYVQDIAASMAFQMLMHCDERHVLDRSFLLWHRVRVMVGGLFGSPMTAPQAAGLARDLQAIDDLIIEELHTTMLDIKFADIMYHLENETLHTGIVLSRLAPNAFQSHKVIPGLHALLNSPEARKQAQDAEGLRQGEIIYRTTRVK